MNWQIKEYQMRKEHSKVNILRNKVAELERSVDYHAVLSAKILRWVHTNTTEEQKEVFTTFIKDTCNELAKQEK
jgi:hypothetical protein